MFKKTMSERLILGEYLMDRNIDSFDVVWSSSYIFIPANSMVTFHQETLPIPALPDLAYSFGASHVTNRMLMR